MSRVRSWTDEQLITAVINSKSYRNVLILLGLVPAGGNYAQIQHRIKELQLDTEHFIGMGWSKGLKYKQKSRPHVDTYLILNSQIQSYKLKKKLFEIGYKQPKCELCGWCTHSKDGRIPVELDHINGNHYDNRLVNLRILCPNCHSLQPTHRGKNKGVNLKH